MKKETKRENVEGPYTQTETTDPPVPNRAHTEMSTKPRRQTDVDDRHGNIPHIEY